MSGWRELWSETFDDDVVGNRPRGWTAGVVETDGARVWCTLPIVDAPNGAMESDPIDVPAGATAVRLSGVYRGVGNPHHLQPFVVAFAGETFLAQLEARPPAPMVSVPEFLPFAGVVTLPAGTTRVTVKLVLWADAEAGGHYGLWDDLELEAYVGETIAGNGRNLLDNGGFRYGLRSWTAQKPTTPAVSGPAVASSAEETLVDHDVDAGAPARFPHDYVNGTDGAYQSFGWSVAPTRTAGKVYAEAPGGGVDCGWQFLGDQFRPYELVRIRCAMRNPTAGGSPSGLLYVIAYAADGSVIPTPELDGAATVQVLPDDGSEVRFDVELVIPVVAGLSSWAVRFGMVTNPGASSTFSQGWELLEAHVELAPLQGNVVVFSPMLPSGQVAPREYPQLRHANVPVATGSTYYARCLVSAKNDLATGWVELRTYGPDGTKLRTAYSSSDAAGNVGGPDLADWRVRTASLVALPGEAYAEVALVCGTPDNVAGSWRVRFDEAGLYEGALPDVWTPSGDAELATLDYPSVTLDGMPYDGVVRSASWRLGRSWWFAGPEAGTASVELAGDREELRPGARLAIAGAGPLFLGVVDDVLVDERATTDGVELVTRVTASDATAWLPGAKLAGVAFSAQPFADRMVALYARAGATITTRAMPSSDAPASIGAGTIGTAAAPVTALDELARQECGANAITQLGPDGVLRVLHRSGLPAGASVTIAALAGDDCPFDAQLDRSSVEKVVNLWRFTDGEEAYTTPIPEGGTSAARYGTREYDTRTAKAAGSPRYTAGMRAVVARALPSYRVGVSILRRSSPVLGLGPFDYASWRDDEWQVLELEHSVRPGRWECRLHLDATQDEIVGTVAPPPTPPPARLRATVSPSIAGDAYIVRTPSGLNAGNGAGPVILVGRLGDDNLARGLVEWSGMTFLGRNRKVVSATLTLTTARGGCMSYGSSPKVKVLRVTGSWSQGSYNASNGCGFATSNSVKYPGPATTTSGAVSATVPATDGRSVAIRVDAIAQAWLDGAAQHGLELQGHTESSSSYRCGFSASGSTRAKLSITYEYDA